MTKLRPRVAMNSVFGLRFTNGRNTSRSISTAPMIITRTVIGNAAQNGSPCSFNTTKVSAPKKTIVPWAKLKTPEAL